MSNEVLTNTAHRAVAVHLRLTLKAFSLSEFVALRGQIAGFAVYMRNRTAETRGIGQETEWTDRSFSIPLARRESLPTIVPMAVCTFPPSLEDLVLGSETPVPGRCASLG